MSVVKAAAQNQQTTKFNTTHDVNKVFAKSKFTVEGVTNSKDITELAELS